MSKNLQLVSDIVNKPPPGIANIEKAEIRIKGKTLHVPSIRMNGRTVIATGKWLKMAALQDEDFLEGQLLDDPAAFISGIKQGGLRADIFAFRQKLPDVKPKYDFYFEWDNIAAISIVSFDDWWMKRVSHDLRKDIKRAKKRGVVARLVEFNDDFVRGVTEIYSETPVRQGRPFWHYQKDFETVKRETGTYRESSDFIGAYVENELIGFIKIVYVDKLGCLMQIISKIAHQDKRPTNALLAKAVEVCAEKNCSYLTYGKFKYGKTENSLTAFKRRNGFEEILVPKYYIPLTLKGRIALALRLHHGFVAMLPAGLVVFLIRWRNKIFNWVRDLKTKRSGLGNGSEFPEQQAMQAKAADSEDAA
ncbi:MAG: hypothetical protein ACLQAH_02950 [Limisphaerales bacterium]